MNARYTVDGWRGVAFFIARHAQTFVPFSDDWGDDGEWVDDPDHVIVVMVGDDDEHTVAVDDLTKLADLDYCAECGQIGCTHDGRDRDAEDDADELPDTCRNPIDGHWYVITYGARPYQVHAVDCSTCADDPEDDPEDDGPDPDDARDAARDRAAEGRTDGNDDHA